MTPRIFISHSSSDKPFVREFISRLSPFEIDLWLDETEIKIGDSLIEKIGEGLINSQYLIVVLSKKSVNSGWVKEELNYFLANQIKNKKVKVLPILIENCNIPPFLGDKYYLDLRDWQNNFRLKAAVDKLILDLDLPKIIVHKKTGMEFVKIPSGPFLFGKEKKRVLLHEYWIGRFPLKIEEFMIFVRENTRLNFKSYSPENLGSSTIPDQKAYLEVPNGHPLVGASQWFVGREFAKWANLRFPTEQEWEKAARGLNGDNYPWGNTFSKDFCNTLESKIAKTTKTDKYVRGRSIFGCFDMIGNVEEFTDTRGMEVNQWIYYTTKGGSFRSNHMKCWEKRKLREDDSVDYAGFRFVIDSPDRVNFKM